MTKQGGALVARQAHNLEVDGSIPSPATNFTENGTRIIRVPEFQQMPASKFRVPILWERGALTHRQAAAYLAISEVTLWRLTQRGKIKKTSYGTYPLVELDRHLRKEIS